MPRNARHDAVAVLALWLISVATDQQRNCSKLVDRSKERNGYNFVCSLSGRSEFRLQLPASSSTKVVFRANLFVFVSSNAKI